MGHPIRVPHVPPVPKASRGHVRVEFLPEPALSHGARGWYVIYGRYVFHGPFRSERLAKSWARSEGFHVDG